jgi:hypothetical protein
MNGRILGSQRALLSLLAAKSQAVHHRQTKNFDLGEGFLDRFQTIGLNNSDDQFHYEILEFAKSSIGRIVNRRASIGKSNRVTSRISTKKITARGP